MATKDQLTPREKLVIDEYFANGFKKRQALIKAGYPAGTAGQKTTQVFGRQRVKDEIARREAKREAKYETIEDEIIDILLEKVRASRVLAKFKKVTEDGELTWDFTGATEEELRAVAELQTEIYMEGRGEVAQRIKRFKIKHADEAAYLSLLMRHRGMLNDSLKLKADEDLVAILQQRGRQVSPEKIEEPEQ